MDIKDIIKNRIKQLEEHEQGIINIVKNKNKLTSGNIRGWGDKLTEIEFKLQELYLLESIIYEEIQYKDRIKWFFDNHYETGMEYEVLLKSMKNEDLDNFKLSDQIIKIPKYKHEL